MQTQAIKLDLKGVQLYKRLPNQMAPMLAGVYPVLRLQSGRGEAPLFVQHGKVWDEGGSEITNPPQWFWTEAARVAPMAAQECGLDRITPPSLAPQTPTVAQSSEPAKVWTCDTCARDIPLKQKGLHIAAHRRKQKGLS